MIKALDKQLNECDSFEELDHYNDCINLIKFEIGFINDYEE